MGANLSYPNEDLSGKVALVTGGNTGIGYETAKALARMGAHTFIGCRSQERAEQAIGRMKDELGQTQGGNGASPALKEDRGSHQRIGEAENKTEGEVSTAEEASSSEVETRSKEGRTSATSGDNGGSGDNKDGGGGEVKIEYLPLDLASFQSTKECVRLFKERSLPLHILVNNAAVAWTPFSVTRDGYESMLQINYLGPILLTLELLPVLASTAQSCGDGRIAFVSSKANTAAESFKVERLLDFREETHSRIRAYCNSKLYGIMMGETLQRKLEDVPITVSSPEPGTVKTEIHRGFSDKSVLTFLTEKLVYPVFARSPAEGAATSINCVVNPQLNSRQHLYYSDCRPARANSEAYDITKQEALWKKTLEILKDQLSAEVLEKHGKVLEEFTQDTSTGDDKAATALEESKGTAGQDEIAAREPLSEETVKEEDPLVEEKNAKEDSLPDETVKDNAGGDSLTDKMVKENAGNNPVPEETSAENNSLPDEAEGGNNAKEVLLPGEVEQREVDSP